MRLKVVFLAVWRVSQTPSFSSSALRLPKRLSSGALSQESPLRLMEQSMPWVASGRRYTRAAYSLPRSAWCHGHPHGPAHAFAREQVQHDGEIEPALRGGDLERHPNNRPARHGLALRPRPGAPAGWGPTGTRGCCRSAPPDLAPVSPNLRSVSNSVPQPPASTNMRRKPAVIARRIVHHCAALQRRVSLETVRSNWAR